MHPTHSPSHEEFIRKKKQKKRIIIAIVVFVFVALVCLSAYLSHRKEVRISRIELNGGILVTQADVESKGLTHLYGSYFWMYPKNNAFWYPQKDLKKYLLETFKRIETIDVKLKGFNTLVVNIKERKPFALWCNGGETSELNNVSTTTLDLISTSTMQVVVKSKTKEPEDCYFMDLNSTIFAKAPNFSGDAYAKYYGFVKPTESESPIGKEYMTDTKKFSEISDFYFKAKDLFIRPLYVVAKENGEFSLVLSGGGQIYFDFNQPLLKTGQNLEAILRTPAFSTSTGSMGDLPVEYIDLRYGNKLFYKLK